MNLIARSNILAQLFNPSQIVHLSIGIIAYHNKKLKDNVNDRDSEKGVEQRFKEKKREIKKLLLKVNAGGKASV